jgi:hypothetical protein
MAGVSMPFSLGKYIDGRVSKREALWRVAKRVVLLFLLGAIVQGNLLGLDPNRIYLYSNTLQAIASGYLITAMLYLFFKERGVLFGALALLVIYWLPMSICGDYTPDGNFAEKVDVAILGRFRDGAYLNDEGIWCFSPHYHYTWIWSSLNFAVTVSLGFITGVIMRKSSAPLTAIKRMTILGASLVAVALLLNPVAPIIKKNMEQHHDPLCRWNMHAADGPLRLHCRLQRVGQRARVAQDIWHELHSGIRHWRSGKFQKRFRLVATRAATIHGRLLRSGAHTSQLPYTVHHTAHDVQRKNIH